jgi:hypothetical protein
MNYPTVYLVSYDLMRGGESVYPALIAALRQDGGVRILRSQWLVRMTGSALDVLRRYLPHLDSNDRMFVSEVNGNSAYLRIENKDDAATKMFPHLRAA